MADQKPDDTPLASRRPPRPFSRPETDARPVLRPSSVTPSRLTRPPFTAPSFGARQVPAVPAGTPAPAPERATPAARTPRTVTPISARRLTPSRPITPIMSRRVTPITLPVPPAPDQDFPSIASPAAYGGADANAEASLDAPSAPPRSDEPLMPWERPSTTTVAPEWPVADVAELSAAPDTVESSADAPAAPESLGARDDAAPSWDDAQHHAGGGADIAMISHAIEEAPLRAPTDASAVLAAEVNRIPDRTWPVHDEPQASEIDAEIDAPAEQRSTLDPGMLSNVVDALAADVDAAGATADAHGTAHGGWEWDEPHGTAEPASVEDVLPANPMLDVPVPEEYDDAVYASWGLGDERNEGAYQGVSDSPLAAPDAVPNESAVSDGAGKGWSNPWLNELFPGSGPSAQLVDETDTLTEAAAALRAAVDPDAVRRAGLASALTRLADRVRSGEIDTTSLPPGASEEAILATTLAAILRTHRQAG